MAKPSKDMINNRTIMYDSDNDIFFAHEGFTNDEKFKGNLDLGNIILDLSTNGKVRGIEIFNASDFFREAGLDTTTLQTATDVTWKVVMKKQKIHLLLTVTIQEKEHTLPECVLTVKG